MLAVSPHHKVFMGVQPIDFRKGLDGIAAVCREQFNLDPMTGHFFIFRNRKCNAVKVLVYEAQGFWLCHKRLSKGQFLHWPKHTAKVVALSAKQLQMLLQNNNPKIQAH